MAGGKHMVETDFVVVRRLEIVKNGARWDRVDTEFGVQTELVVPLMSLDCREVLRRGSWERTTLSSVSLTSCTVLGRVAH